MIKRLIIFTFFWLFSLPASFAGPISNKDVQQITQNFDYHKTKKIRVPKNAENKDKNTKKPDLSENVFLTFLGRMFEWLIYVFIGGICIALIYFIFKNVKYQPSLSPSSEIVDRPESAIDVENHENNLAKALETKNYRLVIRIRFIQAIHVLKENKKIWVETGKTNRSYIGELHNPLKKTFAELVRIFEKSWYDNAEITENHYLASEKLYHQILTEIHES
ncbi:MAG: DUF4129 domain-containing protein [Saprospiraceae bacterium]|nr:DUF4129 domain-containing protein [Saprospiraceae bacterium]